MDKKIIIETTVPIPPSHRPYLYPELYDMQVGESFARPLDEQMKLHNAGQQCTKKTGAKFATRRIDSQTVRIWRIS